MPKITIAELQKTIVELNGMNESLIQNTQKLLQNFGEERQRAMQTADMLSNELANERMRLHNLQETINTLVQKNAAREELMQTRSYEFYEVRVGFAYNVIPAYHGSGESCEEWVKSHIDELEGKNVYIVRTQVLYTLKPDEA